MGPQAVSGWGAAPLHPILKGQVREDPALVVCRAEVAERLAGHQETAAGADLGDLVQGHGTSIEGKPFREQPGLGNDLVGIDDGRRRKGHASQDVANKRHQTYLA